MAVDVTAAVTVDRPRDEVAGYLRDPANDPEWIGGVRGVRLLTPPPVTVGSQVERVASFLGRRVEYVNEVTELAPDRLARWRPADGGKAGRRGLPMTDTTRLA